MKEDSYQKTEPEVTQKPQPAKDEEQFQSGFKAWIRIVAFIVVAVFLPEQVAQAVEYDFRMLWPNPAIYQPTGLKDIRQIDIPLTVRNILSDISGKPVTSLKLSDTLTIDLEKPLVISKQRIEQIYEWLKGTPCGPKALYDL